MTPARAAAQGPMYFLSSRLVAQMAADAGLQRDLAATVRSASGPEKENWLPWEDVRTPPPARPGVTRARCTHPAAVRAPQVYTGLAMARVATGAGLASVHMGTSVYSETWGVDVKPSTLLLHMKANKATANIAAAHRKANAGHCNYTREEKVGLYCRKWYSCNGASWQRCLYLHNYTACSAKRKRRQKQTAGPLSTEGGGAVHR